MVSKLVDISKIAKILFTFVIYADPIIYGTACIKVEPVNFACVPYFVATTAGKNRLHSNDHVMLLFVIVLLTDSTIVVTWVYASGELDERSTSIVLWYSDNALQLRWK